jgi:7-keto-8-aminopelargonate synthetase-like enzyme
MNDLSSAPRGVPPTMSSLDQFASDKLGELERGNLRRTLAETEREDGLWITRNGRRLLSFCCNDYLNLTHHPAVKKAAMAALERYGAGSGASRLVTGNHPLFAELEARLAQLKGTEACAVFGSGYLANSGIIPSLIGSADLVLIDELAHACLWAGARLTRGKVVAFRHNDIGHATELLAEHRTNHPRGMIATDGVFSMTAILRRCRSLRSWRGASMPGSFPMTRMAWACSAAAVARALPTARRRTFRCRWGLCQRPSAAMAVTSAPRAR